MAQFIGKCPYCEDGTISYTTKDIRGRKTKLYTCSNNKVTTVDEGESWEKADDSTCDFRIFGNSLARYGKKFIGPKEVSRLLKNEEVIAHLYSYQKKVEYKKYLTLDETYGVSVIWDLDVEEESEYEEKEEYIPVKNKLKKRVFVKKEVSYDRTIDKEDFSSIVLEAENITKPISKPKKIIKDSDTIQSARPKPIKLVFVNKKSSDEGAAF